MGRGPWLQGEPTWKAQTGEARRRGAPAFGHSGHKSHFIWDPRCPSPSCFCGSWDRGRHAELTPHLFLKSPPPIAWANLESIMLSESRQTQKDKLYDSAYRRCLELADSWRQKVERRWGGRENGELVLNEDRISVWGKKRFLEMDGRKERGMEGGREGGEKGSREGRGGGREGEGEEGRRDPERSLKQTAAEPSPLPPASTALTPRSQVSPWKLAVNFSGQVPGGSPQQGCYQPGFSRRYSAQGPNT